MSIRLSPELLDVAFNRELRKFEEPIELDGLDEDRLREFVTAETYEHGRITRRKHPRQTLVSFFQDNIEEMNAGFLALPIIRFHRDLLATNRYLKSLAKTHGCEVISRKAVKDIAGISIITCMRVPDPYGPLPQPLVKRSFISSFHLRGTCYDGMISSKSPDESLRSVKERRDYILGWFKRQVGGVVLKPAEIRARQTLRDIISEKEWRRYLTNGFVMAQGRSGKWYQIKNNRSHTIVWEKNQKVQELCIVTDHSCPPTDHVLTIKLMVELDEDSVWAGANQYAVNATPEDILLGL